MAAVETVGTWIARQTRVKLQKLLDRARALGIPAPEKADHLRMDANGLVLAEIAEIQARLDLLDQLTSALADRTEPKGASARSATRH